MLAVAFQHAMSVIFNKTMTKQWHHCCQISLKSVEELQGFTVTQDMLLAPDSKNLENNTFST